MEGLTALDRVLQSNLSGRWSEMNVPKDLVGMKSVLDNYPSGREYNLLSSVPKVVRIIHKLIMFQRIYHSNLHFQRKPSGRCDR